MESLGQLTSTELEDSIYMEEDMECRAFLRIYTEYDCSSLFVCVCVCVCYIIMYSV